MKLIKRPIKKGKNIFFYLKTSGNNIIFLLYYLIIIINSSNYSYYNISYANFRILNL
jgi:hypothetical protein